jgi:hypothetical protein
VRVANPGESPSAGTASHRAASETSRRDHEIALSLAKGNERAPAGALSVGASYLPHQGRLNQDWFQSSARDSSLSGDVGEVPISRTGQTTSGREPQGACDDENSHPCYSHAHRLEDLGLQSANLPTIRMPRKRHLVDHRPQHQQRRSRYCEETAQGQHQRL